MGEPAEIWVELATRADLDRLPFSGAVGAAIIPVPDRPLVLRDKRPVYVRLEPTDLPRILQLVRARIPPQAGILVPATDLGFAALAELRRMGKRSLAVWARTPMDWFLAGSAGADVVIAEDLAAATRIIEVARGHLPWLVARVDTSGQVLDALRLGLAGSLVPAAVFSRLHDAELAPAGHTGSPTPSAGEGDLLPACGCDSRDSTLDRGATRPPLLLLRPPRAGPAS